LSFKNKRKRGVAVRFERERGEARWGKEKERGREKLRKERKKKRRE